MRRTFWKLLAMAALAGAVVAGCGDDEPTETTLECGANTQFEGGYCVPDARCDDGEIVTPRGSCAPQDVFCGEGSVYDAELQQCVSPSEIRCGEGTEERDGQCVVEEPLHCSDQTVLVNSTCELAETVCGEGTQLEMPYCHLTEEACGNAAQWDVATGECVDLEDVTCGDTTVEQDDACVPLGSFAEQLATEADVTYGDGQPIVPSDEEQVVFAGTMEQSVVHSFDVDGSEGQWLEVKLYSIGLPSPGFDFRDQGANWRRSAVAGMESVPTRTVLVPADDTFSFDVVTRLSDSSFADQSWRYVGTVDVVDAPQAYDWDFDDGNLDGDLELTKYNFIAIDVEETGEVFLSAEYVGDDVEEATLEVWASPQEFVERHDMVEGEEIALDVLDRSTIYLHLDAAAFHGANTEYEIRGTATETLEPGQTFDHPVVAEEGEVIFLSHQNQPTQPMAARVYLDDELKYEVEEVLAGNQLSYAEAQTKRQFFYAEESGEYVVEFHNTSTSTVTSFLSTSYADLKPTFAIDGHQWQQFEATLDGDGAGEGDWKFALVTTPTPAIVEVEIDITSGTTPNARIYDTDGVELERVFNSFGTTEIDFLAEEAGTYFVVIKPGFTAITGDIEISMQGREIDLIEPGGVIEETYDVETFDILHGHLSYEEGDHVDVRLINPNGVLVFEETQLSLASGQKWRFMELFPGPGEFTLQVENTGESTLVAPLLESEVSNSFASLTLEAEVEYSYDRPSLEEGESEFLIFQSPETLAVTVDAFMGLDQVGVLRVYEVGSGNVVGENESMLTVETEAFTQAQGVYAIQFEAVTNIDDGYELTLSAEESTIFEVNESRSPGTSIGELGAQDTITIASCPNVQEIDMDIDLSDSWTSELIIYLTDPVGNQHALWALTSGPGGTITGNFNETLDPESDPFSPVTAVPISEFEGTNGTGQWTLYVHNDNWIVGDTPGTLHSWGLNLVCEG